MKGQKNVEKKTNLMKNAKILKRIQAEEEILKFFRPNEKPFIYKLLKFSRMNGDVITWDDDTLEVNINGQDYPGSSIVDILSYITDKNSNDLFYMTGDYDTTDRLMLGMPQNTIQTWTNSLSNNSDYYVIKHQHDVVSLQIQIYNRGRKSYHNHKHSQTHKNFFLNILFLILILDLPYCQMVVIQ